MTEASLSSQSSGRPHVVVIGAGFAGINAVHGLRGADVDITIIDRNNFHTFQPLLYQVSTAALSSEEVSETTRSIFRKQKNVKVRVGEVTGVDFDAQSVQLEDGGTFNYDYLIVAAGAQANFFGIEGMEENSWPLYTLADAVRLRTNLITELERAALHPGSDPARSTVVVVGGGPTGVEMSGALASMGSEFIGEGVSLRVVLVEALPRLLNMFSEKSSAAALKDLQKRGVEVMLDTKVASADATGVNFADGNRIESHTIVWGAGVRSNPLGAALGLETGRGGAIIIDENLLVKGKANVFAAGDNSNMPDSKVMMPPVATTAIQQGKHIATQIKRMTKGQKPTPFKFWNKGSMAVIGRGNAVVEIPKPKIKISGFVAWIMWLGVHIVYLAGFRNRSKVLVDWFWAYIKQRGAGAILLQPEPAPAAAIVPPANEPAKKPSKSKAQN